MREPDCQRRDIPHVNLLLRQQHDIRFLVFFSWRCCTGQRRQKVSGRAPSLAIAELHCFVAPAECRIRPAKTKTRPTGVPLPFASTVLTSICRHCYLARQATRSQANGCYSARRNYARSRGRVDPVYCRTLLVGRPPSGNCCHHDLARMHPDFVLFRASSIDAKGSSVRGRFASKRASRARLIHQLLPALRFMLHLIANAFYRKRASAATPP